MKYLVGKYDFKKMDRAINSVTLVAMFQDRTDARSFVESKYEEALQHNCIYFSFNNETETMKFRTHAENAKGENSQAEKFVVLDDAIVYDFDKKTRYPLSDCMISEKDIRKAVRMLKEYE